MVPDHGSSSSFPAKSPVASLSHERPSVTFNVSRVAAATEPLAEVPYHHAVGDFLCGPIESCSNYHGTLVARVRSHPLIAALHAAFTTHRPVRLSPDIVWLTLTQGLAHHVNAHAEKLRHLFVAHQGRKPLEVRRDDFVKGSPENPWPEVFAEFSAQIRENLGAANHDLIVAKFSTTGPIERAASEIALMDCVQHFLTYEFRTLCGIPAITLEGTAEDWRLLASRFRQFARYGLEWWTNRLLPILEEFVAAAQGTVSRSFWNSIYKWQGSRGSGSPMVTGWISTFFPYLHAFSYCSGNSAWVLQRNPFNENVGPQRDRIPSMPAVAPVRWEYLGSSYEMEFVGGLIGVAQDRDTLCLRPEIGWAVRGKPQYAPGRWAPGDSDEAIAARDLRIAETLLVESLVDRARMRLRTIIGRFGETTAAQKANRLLTRIDSGGAAGLREVVSEIRAVLAEERAVSERWDGPVF